MSEQFIVIGLSDSQTPDVSAGAREAVDSCRVFAGGERHRMIAAALVPEGSRWITIMPPLGKVLDELARAEGPVVVFTSGDPLFYGFGATLLKRFPDARYRYFPAFSSLQLLAHRVRQPYQTMRSASLVGRGWQELDRLLIERAELVGVLCDRKKTPALLAARMLDYGFDSYEMVVGEALGGPEERVRSFDLGDAVGEVFHELCCVLLRSRTVKERMFGIADERFEGLPGRPDMITKMPVRLATLSRLNLANCSSFWDVGFCTGSVSIEARLQFPGVSVTAFEKRPECEGIMARNASVFGAPGIDVVMGDFLAHCHDRYAGPDGMIDAAFIGGHGGRLGEVLDCIAGRLSPGGRVVVNAVLPETLDGFHAGARRHSLQLLDDLVLMPGDHNPITIAAAVRL